MTADPVTQPTPRDPIDLLIALEEAAGMPLRAEFIEGAAILTPPADHNHNDGALDLVIQLRNAGVGLAGIGNGYRTGLKGAGTRTLVIPDFYLLRREPTDLDEAYRKAHKGWYSIELLALAGEITSSNQEIGTGAKYRSYAGAGVPVYVVIHRQEKLVYVHSDPAPDKDDPARSHYRTTTTTELGGKVTLPAPYPTLDTSTLLH
jgi:Uma2 family endonuclease